MYNRFAHVCGDEEKPLASVREENLVNKYVKVVVDKRGFRTWRRENCNLVLVVAKAWIEDNG